MAKQRVMSARELSARLELANRDIQRLTTVLGICVQLVQRVAAYDSAHFPTLLYSSEGRKPIDPGLADQSLGRTSVLNKPASVFLPVDLQYLYERFVYTDYLEGSKGVY